MTASAMMRDLDAEVMTPVAVSFGTSLATMGRVIYVVNDVVTTKCCMFVLCAAKKHSTGAGSKVIPGVIAREIAPN